MKFYQWYSQACGGIIGIISCIYCYLRGDLLTYSNLDGNFDAINFNGIIASYILYPLCILTFIMAILLIIPNMNERKILNIQIKKINSAVIYSTMLVGILGCGIYFIIPSLLLLLKNLLYILRCYRSNSQTKISKNKDINQDLNDTTPKLLSTKTQMAINLLDKNANINFITEVTGLSQDYIIKLERKEVNKK